MIFSNGVMNHAELLPSNRRDVVIKQVFDTLDVSETTRREYAVRIRHFLRFTDVHGLNRNSYLEYKRYLQACETFNISTKNKYLISAKVFLDGLYRVRLIPQKITDGVKGFTQSRLHKKDGLTDDDIGKLQQHCSTLEPTKQNIRLRAIIALFLFQGLRQIEIVRLNVEDINLRDKVAFVRGKGSDDKEPVYLHPSTVKVLRQYLQIYRYREGALFRSDSNHCRGKRLTTKSVREIIKRTFHTLDIDGSSHGFRHYFITKLIKSYKGELLTVSKYSRHRSIQMLEVYNDEVIRQEDLPRYYDVFKGIRI